MKNLKKEFSSQQDFFAKKSISRNEFSLNVIKVTDSEPQEEYGVYQTLQQNHKPIINVAYQQNIRSRVMSISDMYADELQGFDEDGDSQSISSYSRQNSIVKKVSRKPTIPIDLISEKSFEIVLKQNEDASPRKRNGSVPKKQLITPHTQSVEYLKILDKMRESYLEKTYFRSFTNNVDRLFSIDQSDCSPVLRNRMSFKKIPEQTRYG